MARLPRVHLPGVLYYVTQQGVQDRPLFRDSEDYQTYLDLLAQYKTKHEFKIFGWALNEDKIHLLVEPYGQVTISEIMRDLTSRYSKFSNGRYGGTGSLFKGRFHNVMVEKEMFLIQSMRWVRAMKDCSAVVAHSMVDFQKGLRGEIKEVVAVTGAGADIPFLNLLTPMNGEEQEIFSQKLKEPVIGSKDFVMKVRAQISGAAVKVQKEKAVFSEVHTVLKVVSSPFVISKWSVAGIAMIACVAIAIPVSQFYLSHFSAVRPVAQVVKPVTHLAQTSAIPPEVSKRLKEEMLKLEGTEWDVKLISKNKGNAPAIEYDRISFKHDQVSSKKLAAMGFTPTFYTLTGNEDGTVIWETMQTGPKGEVVAWRGEWNQGEMRGVLSQQLASGETRVFQFIGSR